jgi:hypothetical protein
MAENQAVGNHVDSLKEEISGFNADIYTLKGNFDEQIKAIQQNLLIKHEENGIS